MAITLIKGNIFEAEVDCIGHQVNCRGKMGKGIAKIIRDKFPTVYRKYINNVNSCGCSEDLLGDIIAVDVEGYPFQTIINIFGQNRYGTDQRYTDYRALIKAFTYINDHYKDRTIAFPYMMGCRNAGGDWNVIYNLMEKILVDLNVEIYDYPE